MRKSVMPVMLLVMEGGLSSPRGSQGIYRGTKLWSDNTLRSWGEAYKNQKLPHNNLKPTVYWKQGQGIKGRFKKIRVHHFKVQKKESQCLWVYKNKVHMGKHEQTQFFLCMDPDVVFSCAHKWLVWDSFTKEWIEISQIKRLAAVISANVNYILFYMKN